ncbi:MAG: hypothetical protein A3G18_03655 [Rhodospirillales bacterium RIFCSPLOWO2_12_FULL_58_28]|nr:MAG: hypothetical protein A3H92_00965 [Rhodospirillales bacterium RIFCSPLOWO2_02_FULL_58_16]OHC76858.1 MAG: hypothetical protein A3G18_03655 [Rhodospirillales bacterium RIFCSPLOWO2_12_FULL_58_28]
MAIQKTQPGAHFKLLGEALRSRIAPRIKHAILHVTNSCNMRCQHCFVNFQKKPNDLTLDEIRGVSEAVNDLIWLDIGGGEPSLRKDLADVIGLFRFEEISIPTNGWFADRIVSVAEAVSGRNPGRLVVTVSLDGFKETHDEMRQKGSFERAIETIRQLGRLADARVKINTVVCERTVDDLPDFMKFVRDELNVDYQGLLLLRGNPINPLYRLPSVERLRQLGREVRPIQDSYNFGRKGLGGVVTRNYQSFKWNIQLETIEKKTQIIPCLGGQAHVVVYDNGAVAPCEILPAVGNVREQPITDILAGVAWAEAVASIKRKECSCTHDCNLLDSILFNPLTYPGLLGLNVWK